MPLLDTPEIAQEVPHGCGATAFAILFRYHFPKKPLPDWGELADPVRGIGPDTLELFVRKEFPFINLGAFDLRTLRFLASFTPVICLITVAHEADHWVCVRGVTARHVYTQDPSQGRQRYTLDEWQVIWKDATAGGAYERFALAGWR